jgi:RNA polymerase-binding transcription factor DksA
MFLPGWGAVLESRWRERLATVTELSLACHDAAERPPDEHSASHPAGARQLRRLMREAVEARRAMSGTEEALARLSAGRFGRCEQCAAAISVAQLARVPETRCCGRCPRPGPGAGNPGALVVTAS